MALLTFFVQQTVRHWCYLKAHCQPWYCTAHHEHFLLLEITDSCGRLFQRFGIPSNGSGYPFEKNCHPFKKEMSSLRLRLSVREKSPSVRRARAIRWKKLSSVLMARYCSKPLPLEPFTTNLSKNVSLNDLRNSSKRYLPSPHEFSRYIFHWIALFAFTTFDYRYQFQSRLSYNSRQIFRTSYVLTFKRFW